MSFSADIKRKTVSVVSEHTACSAAELSGMVRFGAHIDKNGIQLQTEHDFIKDRMAEKFLDVFGFMPVIKRSSKAYKIIIADENMADNVSDMLLLGTTDFERLTDELLPFDCCAASFIRGAFLNGGSVSSPEKAYHLEFAAKSYDEAEFLLKLLGSYGYYSKIAARRSCVTVYMKECDAIAEILGFMGAGAGALEMYNVQAERELRNAINRQVNCETANAKKTAEAAARQLRAIRKLKKDGDFEKMPDTLKEIARLRTEHPDMSLKELGGLTSPPVGRSGVNHRMERILRLAGME